MKLQIVIFHFFLLFLVHPFLCTPQYQSSTMQLMKISSIVDQFQFNYMLACSELTVKIT